MENITGPQIKRIRMAREPRMTQADLARLLQLKGMKIDRAGVAKIEGMLRQVSDIELVLIAQALDVPAQELLVGAEELLSQM